MCQSYGNYSLDNTIAKAKILSTGSIQQKLTILTLSLALTFKSKNKLRTNKLHIFLTNILHYNMQKEFYKISFSGS